MAYSILWCEPLVLVAATYFFWHPTPTQSGIDRAEWFWLLGLLLLVPFARWVIHQRLWTPVPLYPWLLAFIALCLVNIDQAPYTRGLLMLGRPLLGMAWLLYLVELTRTRQSMHRIHLLILVLGGVVGAVALGATNWDLKSADLFFIIERLPELDTSGGFVRGGFNPNEIAGAMTWLTPLAFGIVVYYGVNGSRFGTLAAALSFGILLFALMLGQSRASIIGVLPTLALMSAVIVPRGFWRRAALLGVSLLLFMQISILLNFFPQFDSQYAVDPAFSISDRDVRVIEQRLAMWNSAYAILLDYPLTGVGMSYYRYRPVRDRYPIPNFDYPMFPDQTDFQRRILAHAHNEFVQISTDLGLPGLIVFLGWYGAAGYMVWMVWQQGGRSSRIVVIAGAGGLLAHSIYGLADAIPLWDRFSFIHWLTFGVVAAQFTLTRLYPCYNAREA